MSSRGQQTTYFRALMYSGGKILNAVFVAKGPTTMMSEGTRIILETMKARGIRKVIGCMSGTVLS